MSVMYYYYYIRCGHEVSVCVCMCVYFQHTHTGNDIVKSRYSHFYYDSPHKHAHSSHYLWL